MRGIPLTCELVPTGTWGANMRSLMPLRGGTDCVNLSTKVRATSPRSAAKMVFRRIANMLLKPMRFGLTMMLLTSRFS